MTDDELEKLAEEICKGLAPLSWFSENTVNFKQISLEFVLKRLRTVRDSAGKEAYRQGLLQRTHADKAMEIGLNYPKVKMQIMDFKFPSEKDFLKWLGPSSKPNPSFMEVYNWFREYMEQKQENI